MSKTLLERLASIQLELRVPKDTYNEFGKFHYRSAEDIFAKVKPLCVKNGCALVLTESMEMHGDRHYVKSTATLYPLEMTKVEMDAMNTISSVGWAREPLAKKGMDEAQLTGLATSYARKMALGGLFGIDDEKDSDAMPPATEQTANATSMSKGKRITTKQAEDIKAMFGNNEDHMNAVKMVLKEFGVGRVTQLPAKDYQKFVEAVEDLIRGEK